MVRKRIRSTLAAFLNAGAAAAPVVPSPTLAGTVFATTFSASLLQGVRTPPFDEIRKKKLLKRELQQVFQAIRNYDETARVNVMLAEGRMGRWGGRFRFFHQEGFGPSSPDISLELNLHHGVSGFAFQHNVVAVGVRADNTIYTEPHVKNESDFCRHMSTSQRNQVARLEVIYSCPIRRLTAGDGILRTTNEVIGVVNLDSQANDFNNIYFQEHHGLEVEDETNGSAVSLHHYLASTLLWDVSEYAGLILS